MRPGMPLGRKHFRRSRDAPICYGKDYWPVLLSKIVCFEDQKSQRPVSTLADGGDLTKRLDDREPIVDSEGKAGKTYPGGMERAGQFDRGEDFCCNSLGLRL